MSLQSLAWERLKEGGVENAFQESRWMVELLERSEKPENIMARLDEWLNRRIAGEPFQYIVGSVEFYDVELQVGPGVLIPRPETELLVDRALEVLKSRGDSACAMLDLCTGSGAIPLVIARRTPALDCLGVDLSPEALRWARQNLQNLGLANCRFLEGDLFAPVPPEKRFDLITANPPYVTPDEYTELPAVIKDYEPRMALEAQDNGLALEKAIIAQAPAWLKPGGYLLLEMGETQGEALRQALEQAGFQDVVIRQDWAGRDRIAEGRWA